MNQKRYGGLILSVLGICLSVEMGSVIAQDSNRKSTNTSTSTSISKCNSNIQPVGVEFDREIERQPSFAKAYNDRGEANLTLGNCNKAIEDFDRAIELLPDYSKALVNRGNTKSILGKYEEAIADFEQVSNNGDAIAGKAVAKILIKKREIRTLSLSIDKGIVSSGDRQEVSENNENQKPSMPCSGYQEMKIQQKDAPSKRRFFDYCTIYSYKSLPDQAEIIKELNEAIQLHTANPRAYYYRGMFRLEQQEPGDDAMAYQENGFHDPAKAIQDFTRAISLNPNYTDAYVARVRLLSDRLKFSDAIKDYDRLISIEPNNPSFYIERGDTNICLNLISQAMQDFDKSIQLDPNNGYAYYQRAFIKLVSGNKSGAIADYNTAFDFGFTDTISDVKAKKIFEAQNYTAFYIIPRSFYLPTDAYETSDRVFLAATQAILSDPDRPYGYYIRSNVRADSEGKKQDLQRAKELTHTHNYTLDIKGLDSNDVLTPHYTSYLREVRQKLEGSKAPVGVKKKVKTSSRTTTK
jgi:tetratricopeptide (TPR) repeat protein